MTYPTGNMERRISFMIEKLGPVIKSVDNCTLTIGPLTIDWSIQQDKGVAYGSLLVKNKSYKNRYSHTFFPVKAHKVDDDLVKNVAKVIATLEDVWL